MIKILTITVIIAGLGCLGLMIGVAVRQGQHAPQQAKSPHQRCMDRNQATLDGVALGIFPRMYALTLEDCSQNPV